MNQTLSGVQDADILTIRRSEYRRLKQLEKRFGYFLNFSKHAADITEARAGIERNEGVAQDKLFKELGI